MVPSKANTTDDKSHDERIELSPDMDNGNHYGVYQDACGNLHSLLVRAPEMWDSPSVEADRCDDGTVIAHERVFETLDADVIDRDPETVETYTLGQTNDESTDDRTIEVGDNIAYLDDIEDTELAPYNAILRGSIDKFDNLERRLYRIGDQYVLATRHDAASTPRGPKDIIVNAVGTDIETTALGIDESCDWILDEDARIYEARWPNALHLSTDLERYTADEINAMSDESKLDMTVEVQLV